MKTTIASGHAGIERRTFHTAGRRPGGADAALEGSACGTTTAPGIQDSLLQASQVVARLVRDGLRVEEIRIQGRAQPAVQLRSSRRMAHLRGSRYAWGRDARGRFERYAALMDGIQVQWEVRHG